MSVLLFSAPEEYYLDHISKCLEKFEIVFPLFKSTIARVIDNSVSREGLREYFSTMIIFHDLGKLTRKWQNNLGKHLPSHSTLGAAYLWKTLPDGIKEPLSFAVAIHHTDKGLLGDNIERPDVQAISDGIVKYNGELEWHDDAKKLPRNYFPEDAESLKLNDLKEMARCLRVWAKGCELLEQHRRRLQAALAHHILKLCDISAAVERKDYQKRDDKDFYGGWLMVEEIKDYVNEINARVKQWV